MADEIKEPITADEKKLAPALDHHVVAEAGDTELLGMYWPSWDLETAALYACACADQVPSDAGIQAGTATPLLDYPDLCGGV